MEHILEAPIDLLNNPVEKAGFDADCKVSYKSITKQITIEIESVRSEILSNDVRSVNATFNKTNRECTLYLQIDNLSCQFLIALPDVLGIMSDKVMLEAFHQYLGQESPAMRPYLSGDHFIGRRGCEQVVDRYGDAVARSNLQGGDFIRAHEELKHMMSSIFRQAGFCYFCRASEYFSWQGPRRLH